MRSVNRAVAAVLAATVAAASIITLIEIVNTASRDGYSYLIIDWPAWVAASTRNTWSDTGPRVTGVVLAALGLVLVFLGLRPGPPDRFAVTSSSPHTATFITRRGVTRVLRSAALAVDGVTGARVRVRRRRTTARLRVNPRTAADAPTRAPSALAGQLDAIGMARPPALRVRTRATRPSRRDNRVVPEPPVAPSAHATQGRDLPHDSGKPPDTARRNGG